MIAADECIRPTVALDNLPAYARDRLRAATCFPKDRLLRRDYRLAALDLRVWFTCPELAELCDFALVPRPAASPVASSAEICVIDAETEGWEPPRTWEVNAGFSSREFDRALAAHDLRGFYHHDGPSWQFFDRVSRTGLLTLSTKLGIPPWEVGAPLRLFLHWAHAAMNTRLTHAATLGVGGRGALIVGVSGSGKSGMALAGLLNGMESVGDDYVLLESGTRVCAYPVFKTLKQDAKGLRRLGLAAADLGGARLNWHGKFEFDAGALIADGLADHMKIGAILIPEIARLPNTRIEEANAINAALSLAPSAVLQLPGDADQGFRFFSEIARRLPAFRLRLSEDSREVAETVAALLLRRTGDDD